jgi:uncharacterized protein YcbK (DUF882 family)
MAEIPGQVRPFRLVRFASRIGWIPFLLVGVLPLQGQPTVAAMGNGQEYRLRLYHTHTNERIDIVYRRGNVYLSKAMDRLNRFLRDHRTGTIPQYDVRVFDLLHDLSAAIGGPGLEIDIICGYRTPWSNEFLRQNSSGVALHSLHMQAEAIDIRVPGVATSRLRDVALALSRGGVGYYARSNFVHVDVGRVRRW